MVKVNNSGTIRLPPGVELPEGTELPLTIPKSPSQALFAERYAAYLGVADDLSAKLEHYGHGHGKK